MIRSEQVTNLLLGVIVVLLGILVFRPTLLRLTERFEPRFAERTFSEWQRYLRDLSPGVRQRAVEALGYFGATAVPVLIETVKNEAHPEVRASAATALAGLGPAAKEAAPVLIEASKAAEPRVRATALVALGKVGPEVKEVVPALIEALRDTEPAVRVAAVETLGTLGVQAKDSVSELIERLGDSNRSVQQATFRALGSLGPVAADAVPALRRIAEADELKALRPWAEEALAKIGGG